MRTVQTATPATEAQVFFRSETAGRGFDTFVYGKSGNGGDITSTLVIAVVSVAAPG
jgi:hypothetical protein